MAQVLHQLEWVVPEDVAAFAKAQGVAGYLPALLEHTQQMFPSARRYAIVLESDPEIANDPHIVIELDVALTPEEALQARRRWNGAALQVCPTTHICVFRLSLALVA